MASGAQQRFKGSFVGAAADIDVATVPFRPRTIKLWADSGAAIEHGYKSDEMAGDAYLSTTTGTDAGVTINDDGFTVANGADINVAAATVYFECEN